VKGARPLEWPELGAVARELDNPRDRALFLVMVYTGARISEVLGLDVIDVRRPNGSIRSQIVYRRRVTKGRRESRAVDLHPDAAGALVVYLANRVHGPVFLSSRGTRLSRVQAWRILHAAFSHAGLFDRVSPHSLRHSFAQTLADRGVPLAVIQELLGHADIRDTRGYVEARPDHAAAAVASLPPIE
jgi:integrase/recombinase XerD